MIFNPLPRRAAALLTGLMAIILGLTSVNTASAFPAAEVDAQLRPSFGHLIDPPIWRFHPRRPERRYDRWEYDRGGGYGYAPIGRDYRDYRGVWTDGRWRHDHGYPEMGPIRTITVDCGDAALGPTPLSDALNVLVDGGTLYIKSGSRPCAETLVITRPVTIAGEAPPAFENGPTPNTPTLAPQPGAPCVQVMPGAGTVELRDLLFSADRAGGQACIQSWDSNFALVRSQIHYIGDASALYVSGGQVIVRDSDISSGGYDPAVAIEGAGVTMDNVGVTAAATGLDIAPGAPPITLNQVSIASATGADPSLSPETGLSVRYTRGGSSVVALHNSDITGFRTGVWLDQGARVEIAQLRIVDARIGVVSRAVDLSLTSSELNVENTGVYVVMGHAKITHNSILGFDGPPILIDHGSDVFADDNWIYPIHDCRGYREFRLTCKLFDRRDNSGGPIAVDPNGRR